MIGRAGLGVGAASSSAASAAARKPVFTFVEERTCARPSSWTPHSTANSSRKCPDAVMPAGIADFTPAASRAPPQRLLLTNNQPGRCAAAEAAAVLRQASWHATSSACLEGRLVEYVFC